MDEAATAKAIISQLEDSNAYAECPCCGGEPIRLRDAGLFFQDNFRGSADKVFGEWQEELIERRRDLREQRARLKRTSSVGARAVNIGAVLERLAPCMTGFCFDRGDCRSLGEPIDYVVFEGVSSGSVTKIIFADVKTGSARLSDGQRSIRDAVAHKRVKWSMYEA